MPGITNKKVAIKKKITAKKSAMPKKAAPKKAAPGKLTDKDMLGNFFLGELKDIYWAENHLVKALTKMEKSATASALKQAFANHRKVTEGHVAKLEGIFAMLKQKPVAKKCEAMAGITKEGDDIISETEKGSETRDVGLIMAAQKVEHYEIATYGGLAELARTMGLKSISEILDKILAEEKEADELLSKLAVRNINKEASHEIEHEKSFFDKVISLVS